MPPSFRARLPFILLLAGCGVAYFAFHAVRQRLAPGVFRESFPSFLAPLVMFAIVELIPRIRFRSRAIKIAVLTATTIVAAFWLEGVVPHWTSRATGDASDAVAMMLGLVAYCLFDLPLRRGNRRMTGGTIP